MQTKKDNIDFTRENFDFLLHENNNLSKENTYLKQNLSVAEKRFDILLEKIKLEKARKFASKTETAESLGQLRLIFDEEVKPETEIAEETPVAKETITYTKEKRAKVGRKLDTSKLPKEEKIYDLTSEEKICSCCGKEMKKIGEDISEQIEYIPAIVKVIQHICPKYSCHSCNIIKSAKKSESPIPKSMAGASMIAEVIIKKYDHYLPWYRQSRILAQSGVDIPANTIGNWFMQAGDVLEPLNEAFWQQINTVKMLQADETPVKLLSKNIKGYMWCYYSNAPRNKFLLFDYNDSRGGKVVQKRLEKFAGILQTDGYSGYNELRDKTNIVPLGCWAHCRRKFAEVVKVTAKKGVAFQFIELIGKLYQIESKAKENEYTFDQRKELRKLEAPPILEEIKQLIATTQPPPQSALDKAITYCKNQWSYLTAYVDHSEAEIDNNLVENQIRPFAIGRKNWLFVGNKQAADTAAFFYSLIQTCKLNGIDLRTYLIYVLNQAGKLRRREVDPASLLPQFIDIKLLA
jgi:transposase